MAEPAPDKIRGYDKPTADQIRAWLTERIELLQRSNITDPAAIADTVIRELRRRNVRLVVHRFDLDDQPIDTIERGSKP